MGSASPLCGRFHQRWECRPSEHCSNQRLLNLETKITLSQVCSFLFFQMGKAQAFFTSPARGNLSQTFHRDSPLGRHQTWTFSTREKLLGSSRLLKRASWEGNDGRAPLPQRASPQPSGSHARPAVGCHHKAADQRDHDPASAAS